VTLPQKTLQHAGSSWHWFIGHPDIEVFINCQLSQQGPACLQTEMVNIERREFEIEQLIFNNEYSTKCKHDSVANIPEDSVHPYDG